MKRFLTFLEDNIPLGCAAIVVIVPVWLVYVICKGIYHLLDKLIDKL